MLAKTNADFNNWLVREISSLRLDHVGRIVELGPGPGVGLQEALRAFPGARVWGVDLSREMLAQCRRRNLDEVRSGRLVLVEGDTASLQDLAPVDLVLAAHVLYFWHQPATELAQLRRVLRPGGLLALGYQLKANMPRISQSTFPKDGHLLYDSDDEVLMLLDRAGFKNVTFKVMREGDAQKGRLAAAIA